MNKSIVVANLVLLSSAPNISPASAQLYFDRLPTTQTFKEATASDGNMDAWVQLSQSIEDGVEISDYEDELENEGAVTFSCSIDGDEVGSITFSQHELNGV